ncbi:hypothetical protein JDN40_01235 [Rhodomicrobium vannielii ATCC 17100]|uniref:hypothetical protein n=1 Tax=Rhodomicrobium vannielii TaxID=1069 RepID=UPI00191B10CF|nr:hypothetical protein [Rhodomicrobium vannielii]MBJ7532746.1 hypothetical protein [Rhodomicrobium vannielii ATCC 17100]
MSKSSSEAARARALRIAIGKFSLIKAHPGRFTFLCALGVFLILLIATKSLPYALAPYDPDLALRLNSSNPAALIAKAERLRVQLWNLNQGSRATSGDADVSLDTISSLPPAQQAEIPESLERSRLRDGIRSLALRALERDPLNATAFRLLGEIADTPDRARVLMREAVRRSQRDAVAQFWLLNDSFLRNDFKSALGHAEILLQSHPKLSVYVFSYLTLLAEDPEGRRFLLPRLARAPAWRPHFFEVLPRNMQKADTPATLMLALKGTANPLTASEVAPYLDALIAKNLIDVAYNAWLQFLPPTELETVSQITHPNFEREPSGLAFDWRVHPGVNASVEFVPIERGHAMYFHLGEGRIQFPDVKQFVLFSAGSYRIEGKLKGRITGKRGLRWQMRCAHGTQRVIGETEQLVGRSEQWRNFGFSFDVPHTDECKGQMLRLYHDARSPSEEFVSGEVRFAELRLTRLDVPPSPAEATENTAPPGPGASASTVGWTSIITPMR